MWERSEDDRRLWRERLVAAYPWLCGYCKTSLHVQEDFKIGLRTTVSRHPVCGHIMFYRSGIGRMRTFVDLWPPAEPEPDPEPVPKWSRLQTRRTGRQPRHQSKGA